MRCALDHGVHGILTDYSKTKTNMFVLMPNRKPKPVEPQRDGDTEKTEISDGLNSVPLWFFNDRPEPAERSAPLFRARSNRVDLISVRLAKISG